MSCTLKFADPDRGDTYALFLVGLGLVAVGLLAGIAPALAWWSRRRAGVDR